MRRYRRVRQEPYEKLCAESNTNLSTIISMAEKYGFWGPRAGFRSYGSVVRWEKRSVPTKGRGVVVMARKSAPLPTLSSRSKSAVVTPSIAWLE